MSQDILLIERNTAMRHLLSTVLGKGFKMKAFSNCFDAALQMGQCAVQLLVVGITNEEDEHFGFLQHLSSSHLYSDLPVLVTSENGDPGFRNKCLDAGAVAFFQKPFDPLLLRDCMTEFLGTTVPDQISPVLG